MRLRFTLRSLLIATAVCCAACGFWRWYTEPYRQARVAVGELTALGAFVKTEPVVFPRWLQWLPWTRDCLRITEVSSYPMSDHYPGYSEYDLRNRNLDDRTLAACGRVNTIEGIVLPDTKITDAGLKNLQGQRALQYLTLSETAITDEGLAYLSELPNLTTLNLDRMRVTDCGLAYLVQLKNLTDLSLGSPGISDKAGVYLRECRGLTRLTMRGPTITDQLLRDLSGLTNMTEFALIGSQATGTGLATLEQWRELQMLTLSMNHVTDDSLQNLKLFPKLNYLELFEPDVTDESIKHIKQLPLIRTLNLAWNSISASGAATLKHDLPRCDVQYCGVGTADYVRQERAKLWTSENERLK